MKTLFILSPGHGDDIKGKRSPEIPPGIIEWEFVREIANGIQDRARGRSDFAVVNVLSKNPRGYNKSMTLKERVRIAHEWAAVAKKEKVRSIYAALHTNAAGNNGWYDAHGTTCFVAPNASDLSFNSAVVIADKICEHARTNRMAVRKAKFFELTKTIVPAVLVEILFHTSKADCEIARTKKIEIIDAFVEAFAKIAQIP